MCTVARQLSRRCTFDEPESLAALPAHATLSSAWRIDGIQAVARGTAMLSQQNTSASITLTAERVVFWLT